MKTIEERSKEYADRLKDAEIGGFGVATVYSYKDVYNANMAAYKRGATEQKAIDNEVIKKLTSIMENSAIVLGIGGVEWVNENARQVAIEELRQEILNYLLD